MFPNRPNPKETDEDLLKLQEEYFKNKAANKIQPSVKMVSSNPEKSQNNIAQDQMNVDVTEHLSNTFEDIPKHPRIEKITEKVQNGPATSVSVSRSLHGFPKAKRREAGVKPTVGGSIFASQMKKQRLESGQSSGTAFIGQLTIKEKIEGRDNDINTPINIPEQSYIITGNDKEELHKENVSKMYEMSERDILEEQQNLLETMDPVLIQFLKSRRNQTITKPKEKSDIPTMQEQMKVGEDVKLEELESAMDILTAPESDKWLNFDIVETSKLAWMKKVPEIKSLDKDKPYEARFDFEGHILPFVDSEINEKTRILYHHGEEPERPGYTLQELFQLARSSVIQQKIVALNTIANILLLEALGLYEGIIDLPIEQIFFVLRFCMDDNTPSVLNSCVKALRNLFVNSIDEVCLDATVNFGVGLTQPCLAIEPDEHEDDNTVNDQQLAEKNLIKALLRSDILVRLRYIINFVQPSIETNVYILEILTRISRDSNYTCMRLYKFDSLIESILKKFVFIDYKPSLSWESAPIPEAFRFLYVLCCKNVCYARDLVQQRNIMSSVANILSNIHVSVHPNGLKLQIQVLRLWSIVTKYGLATEHFNILQPILIQLFNHHLNNTDLIPSTSYLMQNHLSSLLLLISEGFNKQISIVFPQELLLDGFAKWSAQLTVLESYKCGKLQIISSVCLCIASLLKYDHKKPIIYERIEHCVLNILDSNSFVKITNSLSKSSNILCRKTAKKSSSNLLSLEAAIWDATEHIVPIIASTSCLPFISAVSNLILSLNNTNLQIKFITSTNIAKYINDVNKSMKFGLLTNWFTRLEAKFVANLIKIAISCRSTQAFAFNSFFYEVTIKCLGIFTHEQLSDIDFIMQNVVFNRQFFPPDVLMQGLEISCENRHLINDFSDVFKLYRSVLGLACGSTSNLCRNYSSAPTKTVVPIDWIYSPILLLYSEQQQNKQTAPDDVQLRNIVLCLRWIYFYETNFAKLAERINPTERYCRISCVFLSKDDLFLNTDINGLLKTLFVCVLKRGLDAIDFNKPIQGLSNFQDFYVQLLEQYQGVSYGNVLFGNYVLLPLIQKYDVKWRKILWSEYAGVVQILSLKKSDLLIDFEQFVTPEETDISLLKCYKRCIDCNVARKGFVLYDVAKTHVDNYVEKFVRKGSSNCNK